MALNDGSTLAIDGGNFYTAPVGTPRPTNVLLPGAAWENMGHTSLEDIIEFDLEGGETTILGTLQKRNLRSRRSKQTESFNILLQQFDKKSLRFYYGANAVDLPGGDLGVPSNPIPTQVAFLAVFLDEGERFGLYSPKTDIIRGDNLEFADTEGLNSMPLKITPLDYMTNSWPYALIPKGPANEETPEAWTATTAYPIGDQVTLTGGAIVEAIAAGTSAATEPTAPAAIGGTVVDGTVTWERIN